MNPLPFGQFLPDARRMKLIHQSRQQAATWWGKQRAQWIRKKVLKGATFPMDLLLDGLAMRCYIEDNISERGFVFMPWRFDHFEREFLLKQLPVNGVLVDVGANVGIYGCSALTKLGPNGRVIAIEPNPPVADRLRFNLAATAQHHSSQAEVKVLQCGVSDVKGTFPLYLNQDNLGASSLKGHSTQTIQVACFPLHDILDNHQLSQIDVMKVDIEGAEDLALVPFLTKAPAAMLPKVLIFEDNSSQWQLDLMAALKSKCYRLVKKTRLNWVFER